MKMIRLLPIAVAIIFTTACASTDDAVSEAEFKAVMAEAKAAYKAVDKVGFAWRDTPKLMKKAEKAMSNGESGKALKLAKKARNQSKNAMMQYEEQKNAGPVY